MLIADRPPADPAVTALVAAAEAELAGRYGDEDGDYPLGPDIRFVVALVDGVPVGSGALQPLDDGDRAVRIGGRPAHRAVRALCGQPVERVFAKRLRPPVTSAGSPHRV